MHLSCTESLLSERSPYAPPVVFPACSPTVHIPRMSATQSMGRLPLSPQEACHPVHVKPATQSIGKLPPSPREACHVDHGKVATHARRSLPPRSAATLGGIVLFYSCSFCQPRLPFPHGFTLQCDLVGLMHQAVENRVGQGRIPQGLMPVLHW
jgi:hypothetical protein